MTTSLIPIDLFTTTTPQGFPLIVDQGEYCMKTHIKAFEILDEQIVFDLEEHHALLKYQSINGAVASDEPDEEIAVIKLAATSILQRLYNAECTTQSAVQFRPLEGDYAKNMMIPKQGVRSSWCLLHDGAEPIHSSGPIHTVYAYLAERKLSIRFHKLDSNMRNKIDGILTELFLQATTLRNNALNAALDHVQPVQLFVTRRGSKGRLHITFYMKAHEKYTKHLLPGRVMILSGRHTRDSLVSIANGIFKYLRDSECTAQKNIQWIAKASQMQGSGWLGPNNNQNVGETKGPIERVSILSDSSITLDFNELSENQSQKIEETLAEIFPQI